MPDNTSGELSLIQKFKQAAFEIGVGLNSSPAQNIAATEAATVCGFITWLGTATGNPVMAGAGALGLALCANQLRLAGQQTLNESAVPVSTPAKRQP